MLRRIDFCWVAQEKDDQLEPVMDKRGGSMGRGEGSKERERKRRRQYGRKTGRQHGRFVMTSKFGGEKVGRW